LILEVDVRKLTPWLAILTVAAGILGVWMIADGLHVRLFGDYLPLGGAVGPWALLPRRLGLTPDRQAWPLLVVGMTWFGALGGIWLGHRWGFQVALGLGLICLVYLGPGTVLGLLSLVCLWAGGFRRPLPTPES
jgi:hypothetical protein